MARRTSSKSLKKQKQLKKGNGLLNKIINNLPVELHLPGYNFAGPGTKLKKRLARGDQGVNQLDQYCKEHDISYSKNLDNLGARHEADKILAAKATKRIFSKDAKLGERAAAVLVAGAMKIKTKLGMGVMKAARKKPTKKVRKSTKGLQSDEKRKKKSSPRRISVKKQKIAIGKIIKAAKSAMKGQYSPSHAAQSALYGARTAIKNYGGVAKVRIPRVLPIPTKTGGALPFLMPLLAAVSALGGLAGGASGIVKTVNDARAAQKIFEETKRHNKAMESVTLGKGLYLKPYKNGAGFFFSTPKNLK